MDRLERVTINGLAYHRAGFQGPPLVLINALGQGLAPWAPLIARLLPRRVLVCETRGTAEPYEELSVTQHADDLAAILAHERPGVYDLVAWCTGPKVALAHHRRDPGSARMMVFLNGAFKHPARDVSIDTQYERDLEALCRAVDRRPGNASRLLPMLASGSGTGAPGDLAAAVARPFRTEGSLIAYARQHLRFWEYDPLPHAAHVRVPILFVTAEHDVIVSPQGVRDAARHFPTARVVEVPAATHYALYESADAVAGLIRSVRA
jgi:pimeloyl-ACP methyl ester carboxylesterase